MDPRLVGRAPRQDDQQMQSAKLSLLTSLLKPEPNSPRLTPQTINEFHPLLVSVAKDNLPNSSEFVKCVARIVTYISPSEKRTLALGDHLVKLAKSFIHSPGQGLLQLADASLNLLHLLGAVFACILKLSGSGTAAFYADNVSSNAVRLVEMAALRYGLEAAPIHKKIHSLLNLWRAKSTMTKCLRIKLREAARTAYDAWLSWLKNSQLVYYEKLKSMAPGAHTHISHQQDVSDDPWYSAPVSSMIPHIKGQRPIRVGAMDLSVTSNLPPDPEMESVVAQHIREVAKIFAGPNAARFAPKDHVLLDGLGQPVSVNSATGKRKRRHPTYYGMMEKSAKSFKTARETLPVLAQVPEPTNQQQFSSRNVPPPMDVGAQRYPASYPPPPPPTGPAGYDRGSNGNAWRGGGSSWSDDRGRGYGGGSRGGPGRGRGRGGSWGAY